jgi:hypothetical protein
VIEETPVALLSEIQVAERSESSGVTIKTRTLKMRGENQKKKEQNRNQSIQYIHNPSILPKSHTLSSRSLKAYRI